MGSIFRMASSLGIIQDIAQFVFKMVLLSGVYSMSSKINSSNKKTEEE